MILEDKYLKFHNANVKFFIIMNVRFVRKNIMKFTMKIQKDHKTRKK